jgi:cobalt-zinc-cadmium resistance protein CzcA
MAFSVGVIVLVYVPILALQGVDGKMFRPMAITVVLALITALALSLTWIPAVAALAFHPRHVGLREPWLVRALRAGYEPLLRGAVSRPGVVVALSAGAIAVGISAFFSAGAAFVPTLDEGDLVIQTTRAADISLEDAVEDAQHLEQVVVDAAPEVERVVSRIGSPAVATDIMGYEQADVMVRLAPRSAWRPGLTKEALVAEIAAAVERDDPWAGPSYTQPIQMRFNELLGGAVTDVAIEIYGEDLEQLRRVAGEVLTAVQEVEGAADARILAPPSVPVLDVRPRVLDAALVGMDAVEVLDVVRAVRVGIDAGETWIGPVRVPIRVRLGEGSAAFDLGELGVPTRDGRVVPLRRIADVEIVETPALVNRHQAQRRMIVGFNVRERSLGEVVEAARTRIDEVVKIPTEVRVEWGGQVRSLEEARARMAIVVPVVMVAILVVLALLFRAIAPALLIFLEVPFAGIGGAIVLWARDMPLSISATIGFIALSGIAVLNGVVLVAGVRHHEDAGASPAAAALAAARERFRPVMMTALVAALGFVPMATATGIGAEVQRPLASVVVGGLVTSTLLTLVVLPAVYPAWQRLWRARRREHFG